MSTPRRASRRQSAIGIELDALSPPSSAGPATKQEVRRSPRIAQLQNKLTAASPSPSTQRQTKSQTRKTPVAPTRVKSELKLDSRISAPTSSSRQGIKGQARFSSVPLPPSFKVDRINNPFLEKDALSEGDEDVEGSTSFMTDSHSEYIDNSNSSDSDSDTQMDAEEYLDLQQPMHESVPRIKTEDLDEHEALYAVPVTHNNNNALKTHNGPVDSFGIAQNDSSLFLPPLEEDILSPTAEKKAGAYDKVIGFFFWLFGAISMLFTKPRAEAIIKIDDNPNEKQTPIAKVSTSIRDGIGSETPRPLSESLHTNTMDIKPSPNKSPTKSRQEQIDDVHRQLYRTSGQPQLFQLSRARLSDHQTPDNPAWALFMNVIDSAGESAIQKYLWCLRIPTFGLASSMVKDEPAEIPASTSLGKNAVLKKNRSSGLGANNCTNRVSASRLSMDEMAPVGWEYPGSRALDLVEAHILRGRDSVYDSWGEIQLNDITLPVQKPEAQFGIASRVIPHLAYQENQIAKLTCKLIISKKWKNIANSEPPPRVLLPPEYEDLRTGANCQYIRYETPGPKIRTILRPVNGLPEPSAAEQSLTDDLTANYRADDLEALPKLIEEVQELCARRREYDAICDLLEIIESSGQAVEWTDQEEAYYDPGAMVALLNYHNEKVASTELEADSGLGGLLQRLFWRDGFDLGRNSQLKFPEYMQIQGSTPKPDLYLRVQAGGSLPWHPNLMPIIFAGECKKNEYKEQTKAQLAAAYHANLILLVLYYLDTRPAIDSPLPNWLYLYGIEYTEFGFKMYAFFPDYQLDPSGQGRWVFTCRLHTDRFQSVFRNNSNVNKIQAAAVLVRAISHALFIVNKLEEWENDEAALVALQEYALNEKDSCFE